MPPDIASHTAPLLVALRQPAAYPTPPEGDITVAETHISILFFTHDRVYKVKKPVQFDFLDYSTLSRRKHYCEEELRLNARLAPGVYLGLAPIARDHNGVTRVRGTGEIIEYAVEMRRLPAHRMMSALLEQGQIDNAMLERITAVLVRFHETAQTGDGIDEYATPDALTAQVEGNFNELRAIGRRAENSHSGALSPVCHEHLLDASRAWLADHSGLLERRVREGRIREGHGDVHAGNVCLVDDTVLIYDCIEFSRRLRCRDVAAEVAFLAMDLDRRCFRGFAMHLIRRYADRTNDRELASVTSFYKLYLATVRGKVAWLRSVDAGLNDRERELARREAQRYFHLAAAYTLPPAVFIMCGLPATGKSLAARVLAQPFEAVVLRSDVIRKELARTQTPGPNPADLYSHDMTRRTYAAIVDRCEHHVRGGRTVIIDATNSTATDRVPVLDVVSRMNLPWLLVEMTCTDETARERLLARADDPAEVSDADWEVYQRAKERFESPSEVPAQNRVRCASDVEAPEDVVSICIDALVRLGASGGAMSTVDAWRKRAGGAEHGRRHDYDEYSRMVWDDESPVVCLTDGSPPIARSEVPMRRDPHGGHS